MQALGLYGASVPTDGSSASQTTPLGEPKIPSRFSSGKPLAYGLRFAFRKSLGRCENSRNVLPPNTFGISSVYTRLIQALPVCERK